MTAAIAPATPLDAEQIAAVHAASWRATYRGLLPDTFLDRDVDRNRLELWQARFAEAEATRPLVLKAVQGGAIVGFACAFLDEDPEWGTLLDNLHVRPDTTGHGIGRLLLHAVIAAVGESTTRKRVHLWVFERNHRARRFYEREGGKPGAEAEVEVISGVCVHEVRYVFDASDR